MSETEDRRFYVYVHKKATTGEVFYVGKGVKSRATSKHSRSLYWNNTVNKHGFTVEKVLKDLTNEEACTEEIKLIAKLKEEGTKLCNISDGGETGPGLKGKDHPNFDKTVYIFYKHLWTNEIGVDYYLKEEGTCYELHQKHGTIGKGNKFSAVASGNDLTGNGWALTKEAAKYCQVKNCEISLWHPKHGWQTGTKNWFVGIFKLSSKAIERLLKGKYHKASGFSLKEYNAFGKFKGSLVKLQNVKTKEVFTGTRKEFFEKFNIKTCSLKDLFRSNSRSKTCHGWQILRED